MRLQSPALFDKVFGSLFIGYAGIPRIAHVCTISSCSERLSHIIELRYNILEWFVRKTLFTFMTALLGAWPMVGLLIRNRYSFYRKQSLFLLARFGDPEGIKFRHSQFTTPIRTITFYQN